MDPKFFTVHDATTGQNVRFPEGTPPEKVRAAMGQMREQLRARAQKMTPDHPTDAMGLTEDLIRNNFGNLDPAAQARVMSDLDVPDDFADKQIARINAMKATSVPQPQAKEALDNAASAGVPPVVASTDPEGVKLESKRNKITQALSVAPKLTNFLSQHDLPAASLSEDIPHLAWLEQLDSGTPTLITADQFRDAQAPVGPAAQAPQAPIKPGALPWTMRPEGAVVAGVGRAAFGVLANFTRYIADNYIDPGMYPTEAKQRWLKRAEDFEKLAGAPEIGAEKSTTGKVASKLSSVAAGAVPFMALAPAGVTGALGYMFVDTYGSLRRQGVSEGAATLGAMAASLPAALIGQDYTRWLGGPQTLEEAQSALAAAVKKIMVEPTLGAAVKPLVKHAGSAYLMSAIPTMVERSTVMLDKANRTGKKIDASEWSQAMGEELENAAMVVPFVGILGLKEHYEQRGRWLEAHANAATHDMYTASVPEEIKGREEEYKAALQAIYDNTRTVKMLQGFRDEAAANGAPTEPWDEAIRKADSKRYRYIDPLVFEKAVKRAGEDPVQWAARAAGDDGSAFRHAMQSGTMFAIPMETYLRDLRPLHDALRPGVSAVPDGATLSTLKEESPLPPPRPEYLAGISKLLAEKTEVISTTAEGSPERRAGLQAVEEKMRDLAAKEHALEPGMQVQPQGEPAKGEAPPPPSQAALDRHAEEQMGSRTLAQLEASKSAYKSAATKAEKKGDLPKAEFSRALERARAKLVEQGKRAVAAISSFADGKASEAAHAASEVHGVALDRLLHAAAGAPDGYGQFSGKISFGDALDALKGAGSNIEFDEDMIRRFVARGQGVGELKVSEVQEVHNALKNLVKISKDYHDAYVAGRAEARAEVIAEDIGPTLAKGTGQAPPGGVGAPPTPPVLPEGGKPGLITRIMDWRSRQKAEASSLHTLFHTLGAWGDSYRTRFINGLFHRDQIDHQLSDAISPLLKGEDLKKIIALPEGVGPHMPRTMTLGDALLVRLQTGTDEGMRDYSRGWGVSPVEIENWFSEHLTKEHYDALAEVWRRLKPAYDTYAAVHATRGEGPLKLEHGRKLVTPHGTFEGGWGGPRRLKGFDRALPEEVGDDPYHGNRDGEETGTERARVPVHSLDQFRFTLNSLAHDIAFSELSRDGWQMIRDPEFRDMVRRYKGDHWLEEIESTHRLVSTGFTGQIRGTWHVDTLFPMLRARVAHGAFGLNLLVNAGQIAHEPLAAFALNINPTYVAAGLARSVTAEGRAEAMARSKFLPQYTSNMRQQLNDTIAQATGYRSRVAEVLNTPSMYIQEQMSSMLAHHIWQMSFAKHLDLTQDRARAAQLADLDASTAMPPTNIFLQPKVVRDRTLGLFFLVRNFPGTVWNLKAMDDWDARIARADGTATLGDTRVGQIGRRLGVYGSLGLGLYLMGHGRNEEEQKQGMKGFGLWATRTMLTEATYGAQITHMLVQDFLPAVMPGEKFSTRNVHVFDSTLGELGDALTRDFDAIMRGVKDPGQPLEKSVAALADAAATVALPGWRNVVRYGQGVDRVTRYYRFHYSDFVHTPQTPVGAAGAVLAGPFRRDSTPFSDFDEGYTKLFGRR